MSRIICPSLILPNINELFLPGEFSSFSCSMVGRLSSTEARTPSPSGGVRAKCTHTKCIDTTLGSHFMQLYIRFYQDGNAGNYQESRGFYGSLKHGRIIVSHFDLMSSLAFVLYTCSTRYCLQRVCLYENSQHGTLKNANFD